MSGTLGSLVRYTSHSLRSKFCSSGYTSFVSNFSLTTQATSQDVDKMATPQELSSNKMFGGFNKRYKHDSSSVGCPMTFSIYFPPAADSDKVPSVGRDGDLSISCVVDVMVRSSKGDIDKVTRAEKAWTFFRIEILYWLSGLTCTDENFIQKAGAQRAASALGVALISPDTSPRGLNVEGESESSDFGVGAGFYLNATSEKWKNWRMYDYVTKELPSLLGSHFPQLDTSKASIFGHSMGGHGALTLFLKNPNKYKSVSAFAPICNPTGCPWGDKAFKGYLGNDKSLWEEYDATLLVQKYKGPKSTILIDQGDGDKFYIEKQLLPENFEKACKSTGIPINLRLQSGYDHSYYFIASFVEDHIQHHAKALGL